MPSSISVDSPAGGVASRDSEPAVLVSDVRKSFGDVHALQGISFQAEKASVLGILGPNGAGKTTMVKVLSTLLRPDSGTAVVAGHDVRHRRRGRASLDHDDRSVRRPRREPDRPGEPRAVRSPDGPDQAAARKRAEELLEEFDLVGAGKRAVRNYSGGMRRRVDIACGLVVRPRGGVPRRAHHRPGSAQPAGRVGPGHRAQGPGHHGAAHHAVPRGGRRPQRQHHRHRQGHRHRGRHRRPAQGQRPAAATARSSRCDRSRSRLPCGRSATWCPPSSPPISTAPTGCPSPPPTAPPPWPRRCAGSTTRGIDLADIALRRPSLDDVFLSITGHSGGH